MSDVPPTLPPNAQPRLSRRKKLTKSFAARVAENLWLKVTAVGLAILLWYVLSWRAR